MKRLDTKLPWHLLPTIFTLAWPTMLEQLMQTAVQYVDTAMVGSLGTQATAAVGATSTVNWLVGATVSAVGVGFLAYISQAVGAGEGQKARKASGQAVLMTLILGIFFTALTLSLSGRVPVWMQVDPSIQKLSAQYFFILYSPMLFRTATIVFGTVLRSVGDTKTPMLVGIVVNLTNVVLNTLMIFPARVITIGADLSFTMPGLGWGVLGAAAASAVAFALGGVIITVALWRHPVISPKGQSILPNKDILRPCFKVALPSGLQQFGTCLGYVVFAAMINSLGDVATAAHTIANTVESAFYIPGYGMMTAAATLAGNALGAGDRERIRGLGKMIILSEVALMVLSGGLLFAFAPWMMGIFSKDSQVILLGSLVLRMVAVSEPFYGVSIVTEGMMQGMGNTLLPFIVGICGMWLIRILGTFICIRFFDLGLVAAWACMIGHNLALFAVYSYMLRGWRMIPRENPQNIRK